MINVSSAGRFLFALGKIDVDLVKATMDKPLRRRKDVLGKLKWPNMLAILYTLRRIPNLETCSTLPISLKAFRGLKKEVHGIYRNDDEVYGLVPDTLTSFDILSRLLLNNQDSKECIATAV